MELNFFYPYTSLWHRQGKVYLFSLCNVVCSARTVCGLSGSKKFSTLSHKQHDSRETVIEHKICDLIFPQRLSKTFFLSKNNSARRYHKCTSFSRKVLPLFLPGFKETWTLSTDFRKVLKHRISWKFVRLEPSCSVRADVRAGRQIWRKY
jgi:hypothetical protein